MKNVNLEKPLIYANTGRPAKLLGEVPVVKYRVSFSNGAIAEFTREEIDEKFSNPPERFEFDMKPRNGFRIRSMGDYQFIRINTALMGRGECDLDYYDVHSIYRNLGLWLKDRKAAHLIPDAMLDEPMTEAQKFMSGYTKEVIPRRVKFGNLEFYKHLDNCEGGPLVYVSTHAFGRAPMKVGKLYGDSLRKLRDWCNHQLGEGA